MEGVCKLYSSSTRSDYWWIYFTNLLICLPAYTKYHATVSTHPYNLEALRSLQAMSGFYFFLAAILMLPSIAVTVRRLRDAGFHWAFIFIALVPLVGPIALIVMLAWPSKKDEDADTEEQDQITA